ncbi:hypothetical protein GCM10022200_18000 [Microbacterium awajiense]|uniref:Transposase n=1 Tax=Microbacterium awajiense TaxID=415214 RepID=A0ABP7AM98_9MICO
MAGSATLTTVPSRKATNDATDAIATTRRCCAVMVWAMLRNLLAVHGERAAADGCSARPGLAARANVT